MKSKDLSTDLSSTGPADKSGTVRLSWNYLSTENLLFVIVVIGLMLRLHLIFVYEINWDEFLHLSLVYELERGEMRQALQTAFVHGFQWVKGINGTEVDQVIAARVVIYILGVATMSFLYLICRRFMSIRSALYAVLCYLSFSFVLRQGNSFRTDPIATCLLMFALWLIVCKPLQLRYSIAAGVLIGLAGIITIKSIFYAPTIAIVLLIQLIKTECRRKAVLRGLTTGVSALAGFLIFYVLHRLTLTDTQSPIAYLQGVTGKTLGERDFRNAIVNFRAAVAQNPIFWIATVMGIVACMRGLIRSTDDNKSRWVTLLSFGVVLGSLLVYTQTFPYYYPFMLAPVAVLCGVGLTIVPAGIRSKFTAIAGIALSLLLAAHYLLALQQNTSAQRLTLQVVHQAFPEPTAYIDRCSMVSSYPKRGLFMSVWGMSNYYRRGIPIMLSVIEQDQPRFLIANRRMLELDDLGPDEYGPAHFGLFKEDVATLKANYIHHWGALYVAGKRFSSSVAGSSQSFEILIDGPYTVESAGPVILDGRQLQPNDVVTLVLGSHHLQMSEAAPNVTLRWGNHLHRPSVAAPEGPLFTGF